ncbi:isopenicillin N synthase family dioxygenase [Psychromonas sp. Urea-02u-13]|uniref:isopenicillin N synthase family dioxygenase n=1 Tax=Psychromonas sp. Urea-02u-13 TaxID=2058326 RepID=UPI000C320B0A|nr:2OG-Fe(II) oxygenase family protein [Psychromonas sp. Urea-02u-13]PKG38437.1 2OG-Fe(II) oxygenase [Psychromonas sp. Urea-02u-13]
MQVQVVNYQAKNAPQLFVESLRETGFAVLVNHPIQKQLVQSIYDNWYHFFCTDEKHDFTFDPKKQDGYFSPDISETAKGATKKDLKEYYHVYPWGRIPAQLEEEILSYYKKASILAEELLTWVEENSSAEVAANYREPLAKMIQDTPNTLLRILHYPPIADDADPDAIRAAAHEDINLLTILPASNEPGLQVLNKSGEWLDVPCEFGYLVINTGDMLQEASNGYFPSTTHRVINPSGERVNKSRISLPLFLHPRSEVQLSERHTQNSYLLERLRELGVI